MQPEGSHTSVRPQKHHQVYELKSFVSATLGFLRIFFCQKGYPLPSFYCVLMKQQLHKSKYPSQQRACRNSMRETEALCRAVHAAQQVSAKVT